MKILYFVHGTTSDNAEGKCSGWKQAQLTELGKEQAIKLGETRRNTHFDIVFTSDLDRAIDTANLAFPNVKHIVDSRLRECNYGDLDGKDKSFIKYEDHIDIPFENGEALKDVEKRTREFILFLKENYKEKNIGIIGHRAPQLALEVITKDISWDEAIFSDWRKKKEWQPGWEYLI